MFYVFGPVGQVYQGSNERLSHVSPVRAITRPKATHGKRLGIDAPNEEAPTTSTSKSAVSAYAKTQEGKTPARRTLTQVRDVMTEGAVTVRPEQSVREAWDLLAHLGIAQAPVIGLHGRVVGLLMRADVAPVDLLPEPDAWEHASALAQQPVHNVMFNPVPTVSPDADLRDVAKALIDTGLPGLPVTDAIGVLQGFVSRTDILRALVAEPPLDLWS